MAETVNADGELAGEELRKEKKSKESGRKPDDSEIDGSKHTCFQCVWGVDRSAEEY